MGLQSALSTALTGLTAAETSIDVVGNNVANSQTVGFKESTVNFATQFLQTQSIGSAPTTNRGGTNPRQVGLGVKVAEISPEFTQGTIEISSNPLDLAIQGDGFFIVEGSSGGQFYSRNGQFKTNANNEIVTTTGFRLLGYGVDSNFEVLPTGLTSISIPLGAAAVAQPTENVFFEGSLDPNGEVGTTPAIIQSSILSDGTHEVPDDTSNSQSLARPSETTTTSVSATPGTLSGTYSYRIAFVDAFGNEGPASNITSSVTVAGGSIDLGTIPPAPSPDFTSLNIYRTVSTGGGDYFLVANIATGVATYNDNVADGALGAKLSDTGLNNGGYSYYVTFQNASTGEETRPSEIIGPTTTDASSTPRIYLQNIPKPSADLLTGNYTSIVIYRNLSNAPNDFYEVETLTSADIAAFGASPVSYIDSLPDSVLSTRINDQINLEGPVIDNNTYLVDVVTRDGSNYTNLFEAGTLSFTGSKGGRELGSKDFVITATSTVNDLISFMEQSMGIVKTAAEDSFPSTTNFGGSIVDSRLQFISNMGIENALDVDLSAFQLTDSTGDTSTIALDFTTTNANDVNGEGASADFIVFDSLGIPLNVRVTTVLERSTNNGAEFRYIATSSGNEPETGVSTVVGTGIIKTDGQGKILSVSEDTVAIERRQSPSESPLLFKLDFSQVSGLSTGTNELSASRQDGFAAGTLSSFIITETGRIQGVFSNGSTRDLGQLRMARFANNSGLEQVGDNLFAGGVNSGLAILGDPGENGLGNVTAGAVELSNTDIGQNLIELILSSTQYRGGARVITAVQELLDELLALRR